VAGTDYQAPIGTISGIAKGNGANALTAAVSGTDYLAPPSGTSILKAASGGALANAVAGTDYQAPIGTISGLAKGNGANALTSAVAGTDYLAPAAIGTTVQAYSAELVAAAGLSTTGLVKRTGAGAWTTDSNAYLTTNQTITLSGDASGSGTTAITVSLGAVGTAGTYRSVTTDAKGRVTAGTNPTTISGYGITDAINKTSSTGSAVMPVGTTAQRDSTPAAGYFRLNSDINKFEGYKSGAWGPIGGGATGGGSDAIFVENGKTVTTNYTITTNCNAMSTGPITVNSGVTVTVPSGSRWVIL
jgi:hypothetical protein